MRGELDTNKPHGCNSLLAAIQMSHKAVKMCTPSMFYLEIWLTRMLKLLNLHGEATSPVTQKKKRLIKY